MTATVNRGASFFRLKLCQTKVAVFETPTRTAFSFDSAASLARTFNNNNNMHNLLLLLLLLLSAESERRTRFSY